MKTIIQVLLCCLTMAILPVYAQTENSSEENVDEKYFTLSLAQLLNMEITVASKNFSISNQNFG